MKLKTSEIKQNPNNPRFIRDAAFEKLVQSIKDFPEMAEVREIVVNTDHVILGGNMRFKAMKAAGWTEVPVRIVDWPQEKQDEFVIKDNVSGGDWDWDMLANQYDAGELEDWGLELPKEMGGEDDEKEERAKFPRIIITYTDAADLEESLDYIKETAEQSNGKVKVDIP